MILRETYTDQRFEQYLRGIYDYFQRLAARYRRSDGVDCGLLQRSLNLNSGASPVVRCILQRPVLRRVIRTGEKNTSRVCSMLNAVHFRNPLLYQLTMSYYTNSINVHVPVRRRLFILFYVVSCKFLYIANHELHFHILMEYLISNVAGCILDILKYYILKHLVQSFISYVQTGFNIC